MAVAAAADLAGVSLQTGAGGPAQGDGAARQLTNQVVPKSVPRRDGGLRPAVRWRASTAGQSGVSAPRRFGYGLLQSLWTPAPPSTRPEVLDDHRQRHL